MRARSRRLLLLCVVVGISGGGILAYSWVQRGLDGAARAAREAGLAAFARGGYPEAVLKLGQFLRRLEPDPEALLRYAQSIRRLRSPNPDHLDSAVAALRKTAGLVAEHVEARVELLELYLETGERAEALEQAEWFLTRDPADARAIRAKALTLAEMQKYGESLALLEARVPPESPRLEEHLLRLALLSALERPPPEILAYGARVQAAQAADPRFRLLLARAHLLTGDVPAAREVLGPLVALAQGDPVFARLLVDHLDGARLPQEALRVLAAFAPVDLGPALQADLLRRLWESADAGAVVAAVAGWGIAPGDLPSPVLGYEVLALGRVGRAAEARERVAVLKARAGERVASAWVALLEGVTLAERPSVAARIAACLRALEFDAGNTVIQYELGRAYRDAGEVELAVRAFRTAAGLARSWAEPAAAGARLLAESGQLMGALRAATEARARQSNDPGVGLLLAMAQSGAGGPGRGSMPERMLAAIGNADLGAADVLPLRLSALAAAGRYEEARVLIEQALDPSARPDGSLLLACAILSRAKGMGLEARCHQRYEEVHGSTPGLALALARERAGTAGPDAGLALFRERWQKVRPTLPVGAAAAWWSAEASYLDSLGRRGEALKAWREVAQGSAGDPLLLRALLASTTPWDDSQLTRGAIDALKAATNVACLNWRFYEARWLLTQAKTDSTAQDSAMAHLRSILAQAPEQASARLLLARIHEVRGESGKALEQLLVARGALGVSVPLELRIARMQLEASDWLGARETLQRILAPDAGRKGTALDAAERMALASMFSRLGERSSVLALLAEGGAAADTEELEARAELFAASGEVGTAERIVGEVLSSQDSVRALVLGAALAELGGRSKDAEAILERLDRTTPDPLARERQRAEHYLRVGTLARAEEHQRRLVSLPGALAGDWRALLACLVAQGKEPEVAAVLDRTRSLGVALARDNEAPLLTDDLLLASRQPELRALGVAYVQDARQRALAGQALQLLGAAPHRAFTALERERLRSLAQQAPRFLVLQMTLADGLMRRRDLEEAVALLKATSIAFPMALEPLRTLAYCERALGRKDRAIEAAKRWRERAAGLAVEPDHFLAQLATPEEAAALLEPHLGVAVARGMQEVLELYGRSRILRGEQGRVRQVFEPWLLAGERTAVAAWGALAGFLAARGESALAIDWLQRDAVTAVVARDGAARIEVAGAWMVVAQASQSESARETALALVRELPESSVLGADDWEKLGQVYESGNDQAAAERAYRKALASPARPLIALNNLCMILGRSGRASEALPLAKELVLRGPDVPEYRDTLATLHQLANELDAALEQLEHSLRLDPTDVRWAVRLLEVLLAQGNRQEAERRLGEFKSRYPEAKMTPERLASWATIVRAVEGEAGAAR